MAVVQIRRASGKSGIYLVSTLAGLLLAGIPFGCGSAPSTDTPKGDLRFRSPRNGVRSDGGKVLWGSDFEKGVKGVYSDVRKEGSGLHGSHSVTTEQARTGRSSLKIVIPAATPHGTVGRYELVANMPNGREGEDRWYGVSFYLGSDWDLSQVAEGRDYFLHIFGFRWTDDLRNGPGDGIDGVGRVGAPVFQSVTGTGTVGGSVGRLELGPVVKDRWVDFVLHVKWSRTGDGIREVWRDGVNMGWYIGPTMISDSPFEHRIGVYEGVSVDHARTLYVDNQRVGTSPTAVDPAR